MEKKYILLFVLFGVFQIANAQSTYYYYYNEKIFIDIDKDRVAVNQSIKNNNFAAYIDKYESVSEGIEIRNRTYVTTTDPQAQARINLKHYYVELKTKSTVQGNQATYMAFVNTLNGNSNITKASPCYKTLEGNPLGLTNNFYVKLKPQTSQAVLYNLAQTHNLEVLGKDKYSANLYILSSTKNNPLNALEYANLFYETGLFEISEPEFVFHLSTASDGIGNEESSKDVSLTNKNTLLSPNDPLYANQWGLKNTGQHGGNVGMDINIESAWNITKGANVKIAVFDHGFEMDHPDLAGNVIGIGFDAETMTPGAKVRGRHGTPIAGIIGAVQNNNNGMSGVAPESDILPISMRIRFQTIGQICSGFNWARAVDGGNADVINCSWTGYTESAILNTAIIQAMTLGRNGKGSVVVFCSGNISTNFPYGNGVGHPGYIHPNIIVVGAMSPCAERKTFIPVVSCDGEVNWGSRFGTTLDVMAPGVKIVGTDNRHSVDLAQLYQYDPLLEQYQYDENSDYVLNFNGSSSAAPQVAGIAALILSVNPCLTSKQVGDIIEQTARKVGNYSYVTTTGRPNGTWNSEMGYGLVDAHAAVLMAQNMHSATLDLYVKDSPADLGVEPNIVTPILWTSDDIWIRNQQDGVMTHQNPVYQSSVPNYVKVRIINKSCVASTGIEQLKLYWAKASSSLSWPNPWNGGVLHPTTGATMGNVVGTQNIPVILPGEEVVLEFPWVVPNPALYGEQDPWHFCLLTKIISVNDSMTFPEVNNNLNANVGKNNNIAWKNVTVINVEPNASGTQISGAIAVGNPFPGIKKYSLTFKADNPETGKKIFEDAEVKIKLSSNLLEAWRRGGKQVFNLRTTKDENILIVDGDNAMLKNVTFNANQIATMSLTFNFLTKEATDKNKYIYHVIQKDDQGAVFGGETYDIRKQTRNLFFANAGGDKEVDFNQAIAIYAEDINEPAEYNWYDSEGNLIYQGKELQIANAVADRYKLEVISTVDGFKDYTEVKVKIKPSTLETISPNPAINTVTVDYKLNEVTSAYLMVIGYYGSNGTSNNYILDVNSNETTFDVSNYPTGFYTVALVCDGQITDAKTLIKQ